MGLKPGFSECKWKALNLIAHVQRRSVTFHTSGCIKATRILADSSIWRMFIAKWSSCRELGENKMCSTRCTFYSGWRTKPFWTDWHMRPRVDSCRRVDSCLRAIWFQHSEMTILPHLNTILEAAQGLWTCMFPSVCTDHFQCLWTLHGISLTFWELAAAQPLPSPFPTSPTATYHSLFTCWPFFWSCYSGWSVGWSLCDCFACLNVCVIRWVVVCVHAYVCVSEKRKGMEEGKMLLQELLEAKVSAALFKVREPETISVTDIVSHAVKGRRKTAGAQEERLLQQSFTVRFQQTIISIT